MKKIGLTLSGGGYRAAAFHIGTLNKLHEMNILPHVDVLSTISGGSITGACYCLWETNFHNFSKQMRTLLATKSVIRKVLLSWIFIRTVLMALLSLGFSIFILFTPVAFLSPLIIILFLVFLVSFQFRIFPVSLVIEKAYDDFFYQNKKLTELKDKPTLVVGSTNLQTSRPFVFSKHFIEDSKYSFPRPGFKFKPGYFPISKAVTASSCVPFAFTPVTIDKTYFENPDDFKKIKPMLVDGGVYDNQGIHKITQENSELDCDIIIISDAGNKLPFEEAYNNTFSLLMRTMNLFMVRIKNFQMIQAIYRNRENSEREVAYLSLGWDLDKCLSGFVDNLKNKNITSAVIKAHEIKDEWVQNPEKYRNDIILHLTEKIDYENIINRDLSTKDIKIARSVGTNLTKLSEKQIDCLIRHAENLTELLVRLYCPSLAVFSQKEFA